MTNKINLPSNKKFGFFFTIIFSLLSLYFYIYKDTILSIGFIFLSMIFLICSILFPKILYPINKLWMEFGLLLSKLMNPLILGFIFFFLVTPFALAMKIIGRDELSLKKKNIKSFWKEQNNKHYSKEFFKRQF